MSHAVEVVVAMHLIWCGFRAYACRLFGATIYWWTAQVDYLDIFSVHGINTMQLLDYTLREGGCMEVLEEYRAAGKIRWIGFSTHATAPVIKTAISSKRFDSVNLHYQVRRRCTGNLFTCFFARLCFIAREGVLETWKTALNLRLLLLKKGARQLGVEALWSTTAVLKYYCNANVEDNVQGWLLYCGDIEASRHPRDQANRCEGHQLGRKNVPQSVQKRHVDQSQLVKQDLALSLGVTAVSCHNKAVKVFLASG